MTRSRPHRYPRCRGLRVPLSSGAGGRLHSLGTLTPRYRPRSAVHIPFITVKGIGAERVVTTEFFYASSDADCCPSGRASTTWHWNGRSFTPGRTTVIRS